MGEQCISGAPSASQPAVRSPRAFVVYGGGGFPRMSQEAWEVAEGAKGERQEQG